MTIWVDADACPAPIREILFRASARTGNPAVLVASQPVRVTGKTVSFRLVPPGADAADNAIAESCAPGDLVVTADVPLAARVIENGATALDPRGELLTEENIGERLSMRDFLDEMRAGGLVSGGPRPHAPTDTQAFANALDRFLAAAP
jgi:uncharacterized protein